MKLIVLRATACLAFLAAVLCGVLAVYEMRRTSQGPELTLLTLMLTNLISGMALLAATRRIEGNTSCTDNKQ